MRRHSDDERPHQDRSSVPGAKGLSRRHLLTTPLALGAGSVAVSSLGLVGAAASADPGGQGHPKLDPRYFPLGSFNPEINLRNKLAVVTGASRGIGRAVGDALRALGVNVIGTSRNPATVPNPPAFPLLKLDIANPASVRAFPALLAAHPAFQVRGKVDILCNNAGRMVAGQIIPLPPTDPAFYLAQRELGIATTYSGPVMMTNVMLPLMSNSDYARIVFTVSSASYITGFHQPSGPFADLANAGKAALRGYANCLAAALRAAQSSIRISCVHPYAVHTEHLTHPNPIYTQPVDANGLSTTDQAFNAFLTFARQLLANGLPPQMVGNTYAQLLQMTEPELNVVVGSPTEPLYTQGANALLDQAVLDENKISALPLR